MWTSLMEAPYLMRVHSVRGRGRHQGRRRSTEGVIAADRAFRVTPSAQRRPSPHLSFIIRQSMSPSSAPRQIGCRPKFSLFGRRNHHHALEVSHQTFIASFLLLTNLIHSLACPFRAKLRPSARHRLVPTIKGQNLDCVRVILDMIVGIFRSSTVFAAEI